MISKLKIRKRKIRHLFSLAAIILPFVLIVIVIYKGWVYHWEMSRKEYISAHILSPNPLTVGRIHQGLLDIYDQQNKPQPPINSETFWSLLNRFNLTKNNFHPHWQENFPNSHQGRIFFYHLNVTRFLDDILNVPIEIKNFIDLNIDERRQNGFTTNVKLKEFAPITDIIYGKQICDHDHLGNNITVIFIVTRPNDFRLRSLIRKTWAKPFIDDWKNFRVYFPIGLPDERNYSKKKFQYEQENFNDIIQWNYREDYGLLTVKSVGIMRWLAVYCPLAKRIFKVDDDSMLSYPGTIRMLSKISDDQNDFVAMGHIWESPRPVRFWSKFYTSYEDYPYLSYSDYVSGSGYFLMGRSISLISYAVSVLELMPALQWEDTYMTALIPDHLRSWKINYQIKPMDNFQYEFDVENIDQCQYHSNVIFTQKISIENIENVWNRANLDVNDILYVEKCC